MDSVAPAENHAITGVVSGLCMCKDCTSRTTSIYRMVGICTNCRSSILMLFRHGDKAAHLDCPICGVWHAVMPLRLATVDEIPTLVNPSASSTLPTS